MAMKITPAVVKEIPSIINELERLAKNAGFDLDDDESIARLNLITDGERLHHRTDKNEKPPKEWHESTFAERVIANAYDFLYRLHFTINNAHLDKNECGCCNSEGRAISYLGTLHYLIGFLQSYPLREFEEKQQEDFLSDLGKRSADIRHSAPGGSRDKRHQIVDIWLSGKYTSRDICAEQECAALGMSFSTARKALRNTPDIA